MNLIFCRSNKKHKAIKDPCLPAGMPLSIEDSNAEFVGTGSYSECKSRMEPLLNLTVPCHQDPCSLNGVHQPPIDFYSSQFYGFSEFWYSMEDVFRIGGRYQQKKFDKEVAVSIQYFFLPSILRISCL